MPMEGEKSQEMYLRKEAEYIGCRVEAIREQSM